MDESDRPIQRYGKQWPPNTDELQIEFWCIRQGERWLKEQGRSLAFHYNNCRRILWPELDEHRWHKLCLEKMCEFKICVLMGAASTGKTHSAAWFALVDYFVFPNETCILVTSTTIPGLKKRVWGEITMLWTAAVAKKPWLPGHMLDSAIAITTDDMEDLDQGERKARDMRRGIFGIACVQGGKFVGLARFIGIKQKRMRLIADEASAMEASFLSSFANLNQNEDFRAIVLGNPNDIQDPLGKCAEPLGGWSEKYLEPEKTEVWPTRFMNGCCVNLVGYDSPNFDYEGETRYKYLISKEKIADTLSFFAEDSAEFYSMCKGVMKVGTMARRVLTRELCDRFGACKNCAFDESRGKITAVYFIDAGYGGDRCVAGPGWFGYEVGEGLNPGKLVLKFGEPKIIPIKVNSKFEPEEQIAMFVKEDCEELGIQPDYVGHDATGRGSLGTFMARIWSDKTHPVEFGGKPTKRIVSLDLYVEDKDTKQKRHKRCDEHYDRRVSEYWFQVRYAVESGQVRELPEEAREELCARKWDRIRADNLISVEPKTGSKTKPGMKERTGKSPDMGDWAAGVMEMARRHGFQVEKLGQTSHAKNGKANWIAKLAEKHREMMQSRALQSS